MVESKPTIYVFHGDDPVGIGKQIDHLIKKQAELGPLDFNFSRLDAQFVNDEDLSTATRSLPFLAERRLVVLENAGLKMGKDAEERCTKFLDSVPETTALVLVVMDEFRSSKSEVGQKWLTEKHWFWTWRIKAAQRVYFAQFRQPHPEGMAGWIRNKAVELGGRFSQAAAETLADQVGNNTLVAEKEIVKLLTYVDGSRPVEQEDVDLLTAQFRQVNVFDLVDAIGLGKTNRAMHLLHELLDAVDAREIFPLVIRQFRLLIQSRELLDEGGSKETIQRELNQKNAYVAGKLAEQARQFTPQSLSQAYHRLLDLDEGSKTGQWTMELALELFITEMGGMGFATSTGMQS